MTDIAVVVPTFRRVDGLRRLLDGLAAQTLPAGRWEAVIVDDASGPDYAGAIDEAVAASAVRARVIHCEVNRRQAAARNLGWRSCDAPIVAFTDDDCVPRPEWLEAGLSLMSSDARIGIAQGPTLRPSDGQGAGLLTVVREVREPSPWFEGCNLFVRRLALEQSGGFDEELPDFAEETSMAWAVLDQGWGRGWAPEAVVEHELSERPWAWHLRFHYLQGRLVRVAAAHPAIRSSFWRPWAVSPDGPLLILAAAGCALAVKRRPAVLAALPYLVSVLGPPVRRRDKVTDAIRVGVFKTSTTAAAVTGKVIESAKSRQLLL